MKNVRNSVVKTGRGLNKTNLQILIDSVNSKKLRKAIDKLKDVEIVELAIKLEELKSN
jgi:hypothetical protein